jgi:hypothetical protein
MLKKLIGLVALTGVVGVGAVSGCSVTTTNTTTDGGGTGPSSTATTTTTTTTPVRPDGGRPDAGPASCYAEDEALALTGTAPSAGQNKCTTAQAAELKTKCLGTGATGCDAFIDANKDCARCVFGKLQGETADAPVPALIPVGGQNVSPNIASCAALVIGRPDCAVKLAQNITCTSSACSTCEGAADDACNEKANAEICKTTFDKACNDAVNAAAAQWQPVCRGTNFDDTYPKVVNYMCGAGSTDAGGGG